MQTHSVNHMAMLRVNWVGDFLAGWRQPKWWILCGALLYLLSARCVFAGMFNISPVKIELTKKSSAAVIYVRNTGATDTTIQLHTMRWTQVDGEDKLQITREIIATPQIFIIKAGATQLIRIGMLGKPNSTLETAYRLLLEEIPFAPEPGFKGLQVALKISIPIFVQPESKISQELDFSWTEAPDNQSRLVIANHGSAHAQILRMKVADAVDEKSTLWASEKTLYILPGQQRNIDFKPKDHEPASTTTLIIKTETDTGNKVFHAKFAYP
jgi:fimbrial chaperone protein